MGKVSIGLRGWRFDESAVFDEQGNFRPFEDIPEETRHRLVRLAVLLEKPCDACWLVHGEDERQRCNVPEVVYGEPLAEVLLCAEHEADFEFWFREAGGNRHAGTGEFQDRFYEWFAAGNRAPEGYRGIEHVETDPETLPDPHVPDQSVLNVELPEAEQLRIDLREMTVEAGGEVVESHELPAAERPTVPDPDGDPPPEAEDLDLDVEYPTGDGGG